MSDKVCVYHPEHDARVIDRAQLEPYLSRGWFESPADFGKVTYPAPPDPMADFLPVVRGEHSVAVDSGEKKPSRQPRRLEAH